MKNYTANYRKPLALLLAIIMLFGMFSVGAFAEEDQTKIFTSDPLGLGIMQPKTSSEPAEEPAEGAEENEELSESTEEDKKLSEDAEEDTETVEEESPDEEAEPEFSVEVTFDLRNDWETFESFGVFSAEVTGDIDPEQLIYQWQISYDGETWEDIPGANKAELRVTFNAENGNAFWHVIVSLPEPEEVTGAVPEEQPEEASGLIPEAGEAEALPPEVAPEEPPLPSA